MLPRLRVVPFMAVCTLDRLPSIKFIAVGGPADRLNIPSVRLEETSRCETTFDIWSNAITGFARPTRHLAVARLDSVTLLSSKTSNANLRLPHILYPRRDSTSLWNTCSSALTERFWVRAIAREVSATTRALKNLQPSKPADDLSPRDALQPREILRSGLGGCVTLRCRRPAAVRSLRRWDKRTRACRRRGQRRPGHPW